jgi:hypothetical protein
MNGVFYVVCARVVITKTGLEVRESCSRVRWLSVVRKDLIGIVEESPLIEAVTRERLLITQQTEKT